ncbi:MAG: site-specific integrase [Treponema sp.]|jgi:site-specific recombinase XerD|nr:site-specific integrase [Treponema sp.]
MEVVYFFSESENVRVPFLGYDRRLFNTFVTLGGVWNNVRHEFTLRRSISAEQFSEDFPDIVCVWVDTSCTLRIFGFWERPWEEDDKAHSALISNEKTASFPEQISLHLPEKFSDRWRIKLENELRSRKYSPRTMRLYIYYNRFLCRTIQKPPEEIQSEDVTLFLANIEKDREYSASSLNLAISAIKFFYKNVLKNKDIKEQNRPNHNKRLPMVLSKAEIAKILGMERNLKHRLLLMLVYSSGLRVSEVVALQREHIDLSRKVIYIRQGKGRKDRSTLLSEKVANTITEYCDFFGIETWLFPGQPVTHHLSIRSAQYIFNKALSHAEISKKISIHSLRHTFATHLLESGTDIRYIQELLGHSTIRTTERYTHVARRSILSIQSPLDTI